MSRASEPVILVRWSLTALENFEDLVDEVAETIAHPVSALQVTALLETAGITDTVARRRYDYPDVFTLAEDVTTALRTAPWPIMPAAASSDALVQAKAGERLQDYLRGPLSLLPLILLMAMVNAYQAFGQWRSQSALILSAATIGSLLVTGGFVQVMARRGSIYLSQDYVRAAQRFILRIFKLTAIVVPIAALGLALIAARLDLLGPGDGPLLVTAFLMLSGFWMLSGVLAVLRQIHWFGLGLGLGAAASFAALHHLASTDISPGLLVSIAATLGFAIAAATMAIAIVGIFHHRAAQATVQRVVFPPPAHLSVALAPYFLYGVAYLLGVLAGRVGGWVGARPPSVSRIEAGAISELGLTLALTGYMLVGGVAEHTLQRFWQIVKPYQTATPALTPEAFVQRLRIFYRRERQRFAIALGLCSAGVVVALVVHLILAAGRFLGMTWTAGATLIFAAGLLGYGLLAVGIFDTMLLITLSRPRSALLALSIYFVLTLAASIRLGVTFSYAHGALGAVVGGLAFVIIARISVTRLIERADYAYYASF